MDNNPSGTQSTFYGQKVSIPGINVNSAGDNQLVLKDNYSTRLYYNSNGVAIVLLGLRSANTANNLVVDEQGLFVSQSGIDVTQATDAQLIFNSQQNIFKINRSGTINGSVTNASPNFSFPIDHNLGYTPGILAYGIPPPASAFSPFTPIIPSFSSNFTVLPTIQFAGQTINTNQTFTPIFELSYSVNETALTLEANLFITGETGPYPFSFSYFILEETIP